MNVCGTTRLLVPGFMVGLGVSTFTGNDLFGWIAAALTISALAVLQKVRVIRFGIADGGRSGHRPQAPHALPLTRSRWGTSAMSPTLDGVADHGPFASAERA
jgi:hypothetical protein